MSIHPVKITEDWLIDGVANVILGQLRLPSANMCKGSEPRPNAIQPLRDLLSEPAGRKLNQIITGGAPAILVFPELAFDASDWEQIDELIRGYPSPLIVLAGFGFVTGQKLLDWASEAGATKREGAWAAGAAPASDRLYNCGWCWVHGRDGNTRCILFHKTSAEQRKEILVEGLAQGPTNFCLELNDLIIFPAICSDLLRQNDGHYTLHQAFCQHLAKTANDSKRILVAGILLQNAEHVLWRNAIADATRSINMDRVNVCLVNGAAEILAYDESIDRWRDYTGVYAARGGAGRDFSEDCFRSVRVFSTEQITGAVSRNGAQCVLGGAVRWESNAVGRHLWTVQKDYGIGEDGTLNESPCGDRFKFELSRFISRATKSADGPAISKKPFSKSALESVAQHAAGNGNPSAEFLCRSVLHGAPDHGGLWPHVDADRLSGFFGELEAGVRTVGAFVVSGNASWRDASQDKGQLRTPAGTNILVWFSPDRSITVREKIDHWKIGTHPAAPLIVFSKCLSENILNRVNRL